jgi:hypothetical protein
MTEVTQIPNAHGITFVSEDKVPPAPRPRTTDTERWATAKLLLEENPGQWACVKNDYDSAQGAQSKSSQINNNNTKDFPADKGWEARHEVTRKPVTDDKGIVTDRGASALYLRFNPPPATKVASAEE